MMSFNYYSFSAIVILFAIIYQDLSYSNDYKTNEKRAPVDLEARSSQDFDKSFGIFKVVGNSGVGAVAAALLPNNIVMVMSRGNGGGPLYTTQKPKVLTAEYDLKTNTAHGQTLSTDIWCTGGSLLPDGRLLSVGGISNYKSTNDFVDDGKQSVRIFNSKSTPGNYVSSSWVEKDNNGRLLKLRTSRFYPGVTKLADGRVFVFGGSNSGGRAQDAKNSYEIFPADNELISSPFLTNARTTVGSNDITYPFAAVLPSSNIFIFAGKNVLTKRKE
jgi:hypothetical protein